MHSVKMRPTLTDVARSVCMLVTTVSPNKVVEPIEMTFSMCPQHVLGGGPDSPQNCTFKGTYWDMLGGRYTQ